ncbi:hypothetical protein ACBI99_26295 [Nonomuraea sp. ATR24]|uniref:hypothetical protein n=1 Tax=Nonomuraea sp. ATR24 TaxID=1676744 RepID=UPI0035C1F14C
MAGIALVRKAPGRRPEVESVERAVRGLGLTTVRITPPATLDGGDVLQTGPTVYAGRSGRTNDAGIAQLSALLPERDVVTVDISEFEKLEGCVTCLSVLIPAPR